ncbi:MAG: UvrD-helicase domain-containing protein [Clostridia bacterium]|nr:UvrD-helicase domain-containing protein [Clostridia bacterium]
MDTAAMIREDAANRERLSTRDFDRNFLVSAGAGAGKTHLTVERAVNLLLDPESGTGPRNIVMITFTRKAAAELKDRMNKRLRTLYAEETDAGRKARIREILSALPEVQISTIHSFCRKVLDAYPLESGIGFAPLYESEEAGSGGMPEAFFNTEWARGRFSRTAELGFSRAMTYGFCTQLEKARHISVQYIDVTTEEGRQAKERILRECRRIIRGLRESMDEKTRAVFHRDLAAALTRGDQATDAELIRAIRFLGSKKVSDARVWYGKSNSKTVVKAVENLTDLLGDIPMQARAEASEAIRGLFDTYRGMKKTPRADYMLSNIPALPGLFRNAAELVELLPDDAVLGSAAEDVSTLIHGIITGEALAALRRWREYCRRNHIVALDDMLYLTKRLVSGDPRVRAKLHERYRTFFVDEYQDTDPVQTDIIFGITADVYDPDWHKCVPAPGSLFLVGDAKQGIYRFRGADISLWNEAEEAMTASGGEVVRLYKNYRSTPGVCGKMTEIFTAAGRYRMEKSEFQAEYTDMAAHREAGPPPVLVHNVQAKDENEAYDRAAEEIARMIRRRVDSGENKYGDFLLLSYFREDRAAYTDQLRAYDIPVKFDGKLSVSDYPPLRLLNLRVQAVVHPFNEALSFQAMHECRGITLQQWHRFRADVRSLPDETRLNRYTDIRSLMGHTDELARLLPDTALNRDILRALEMLDRDRRMSRSRTPCGFLQALAEDPDGLFTDEYDANAYQNQYAALLQAVETVRGAAPQSMHDMAEQLQALADSPLDRMPSIRADDNYVRVMNTHKAKGLQGKILILLPHKEPTVKADSHIRREGVRTLGWFPLTAVSPFGFGGTVYKPAGWSEAEEREKQFLSAEQIRLKYVALTRAENEIHVYCFDLQDLSGIVYNARSTLWDPVADAGTEWREAGDLSAPADAGIAAPCAAEITPLLPGKRAGIGRKQYVRFSPSTSDSREQTEVTPTAEAAVETADAGNAARGPGGPEWGTLVHRAAELIVRDGRFTDEAVRECAARAAEMQFTSEIMDPGVRAALRVPASAVSAVQIREYLTKAVSGSLLFMADETSAFRARLRGAVCYPELPFVLSVQPGDPLYEDLRVPSGAADGQRIEVSGRIDLALRYPDGTWAILDYKTDRVLPRARLEAEYAPQLNVYKAVLAHLTGEPVIHAGIITV